MSNLYELYFASAAVLQLFLTPQTVSYTTSNKLSPLGILCSYWALIVKFSEKKSQNDNARIISLNYKQLIKSRDEVNFASLSVNKTVVYWSIN